jgi:N-acetylglucosamine kinase-like BadF-type ATPase
VTFGSEQGIAGGVYGARSPVAAVAAFARDVADVARAGDADALTIWQSAGEAIGRSILGAWRRTFPDGRQVPVRLVGSILDAGPLLLDPCRARLDPSGLDPQPADVDPLEGARRLATGGGRSFPGLVFQLGATPP